MGADHRYLTSLVAEKDAFDEQAFCSTAVLLTAT